MMIPLEWINEAESHIISEMSLVDRERAGQSLLLTPTQEQVGLSILGTLQGAKTRTLVILEGLSGVGKTAVLNHIQEGVTLNGGLIVEADRIRFGIDRIEGYLGHLVTTYPTSEFGPYLTENATEQFKDVNVVIHTLPAMTEEELLAFTASHVNLNRTSLSLDEIVKYSVGVPLLVRELAVAGVTPTIAPRITANYLNEAFGGTISSERIPEGIGPYIKMQIPDDVLQLIPDISWMRPTHIYDNLHLALEQQQEQERKGVLEESPLFIAPESEGIYDTMLTRRDPGERGIDILVPNLTIEDLIRIQQAFGYIGWRGYDGDMATRREMFIDDFRKVSFWNRDADDEEQAFRSENDDLEEEVHTYLRLYLEGRFGFRPMKTEGLISFYLHAHEHSNKSYRPTKIGWMTESLLQQRGIFYFVNNYLYGISYIYNPETQHIEILPEKIKIKPWE